MRCVVNYLSRKAAAFIRARLKTWLTAARSIASDQANVLICGFFLAEALVRRSYASRTWLIGLQKLCNVDVKVDESEPTQRQEGLNSFRFRGMFPLDRRV
jgi:hypothetical protein